MRLLPSLISPWAAKETVAAKRLLFGLSSLGIRIVGPVCLEGVVIEDA
jgi:hypothetical protein